MSRRGRTVLLATALALLAVLAGGCLGEQPREVNVELTRTHNLFTGSPVKVLGVEVGRVHRLASPEGSTNVTATLRLDPAVDVPADATAQLVQGTVLGERFVQLAPAYTGGPRLEDGGTIPVERTAVPAEFDELLASLRDFLEGLPAADVDRFLGTVADTLEGQGEELGETLAVTGQAVETLRANDDELVDLLSGVADLTETLGSRDAELRTLLDDYAELTGTLSAERETIDLALAETARLVAEVEDLLEEQGGQLGASTEVLTRIGRTIDRNHEQLRRAVVGQAELYRHAERVFDRERNWLPLINHAEDLPRLISERLANRFAGLCARGGLDECSSLEFWSAELPVNVCLDPLLPCELPDGAGEEAAGFEEAVAGALERVPALEEELAAGGDEADDGGEADAAADADGGEGGSRPDADDGTGESGALGELLGGLLGGDG